METSVAGIRLEHPVMNAAGPRCKTVEEINELAKSLSAAVMVGSITKEPREGNKGEIYWSDPAGFSLNSLGLPNGGAPYYQQHLHKIAGVTHAAGKSLWVSVAGFTPLEYGELAQLARWGGADVVELNLGCPNVWEGGKQKRIFSFDPSLVETVLGEVEMHVDLAVAVKVSPFSDPVLLEEVASIISSFNVLVRAVTAVNTFPNSFAFQKDGVSAISPQFSKGLAGMAGGPAFKAIGLGQVMQWRAFLPASIDVSGAGGVRTGQDVLDYLQAGAKAVQIGTAHADEGAKVFDRILMELASLREAETVPP